jgi:hypothetical protein
MLLSIVMHMLAAIALATTCGSALHFILLVSPTFWCLIGLGFYLLIFLFITFQPTADADN